MIKQLSQHGNSDLQNLILSNLKKSVKLIQPRKHTKLFKMLQFIGTGEVSYSEMQAFGCKLNGRDFDLMEMFQPSKYVKDFDGLTKRWNYRFVKVGNPTTRRVNRGYWTVNIGHAIKMGYIKKDCFTTLYHVVPGISLL